MSNSFFDRFVLNSPKMNILCHYFSRSTSDLATKITGVGDDFNFTTIQTTWCLVTHVVMKCIAALNVKIEPQSKAVIYMSLANQCLGLRGRVMNM